MKKIAIFLGISVAILICVKTDYVRADDGKKVRIAVLDFENKVPAGQSDLGWGMADMLITALRDTGKYKVLEREALADILGEQDFTNSSRADKKTKLRKGKLLGAQLLIKGAVTEFSFNTKSNNVGFGYKGFGIGITSAKARVAADIRVVDATTGEIIESHHDSTEISSSGAQFSGSRSGFSFGLGGNRNHPLGKAARELIEKMVGFVGRTIDAHNIEGVDAPEFKGRIVKVEGPDRIVINGGKDDDIKVGDKFDVYHPTEELVDPETGEVLGSEKEFVGRVEVIRVEKRYSISKSLAGEGFIRNDIIQK